MDFIRTLERLKVLTNKFSTLKFDDPRYQETKDEIERLSKSLDDVKFVGGEIK